MKERRKRKTILCEEFTNKDYRNIFKGEMNTISKLYKLLYIFLIEK